MDLVEAFERFVQEQDPEAAGIVFELLTSLGNAKMPPGVEADDVVARALGQLQRTAPTLRNRTPEGVRAYLRRTFKSAKINELRARKRLGQATELARQAQAEALAARQRAQIDEELTKRFKEHVPLVAEAMVQPRYRDEFFCAVGEMLDLQAGRVKREALYPRYGEASVGTGKLRARLYALHSRSRAKLIEYFTDPDQCAERPEIRRALGRFVEGLKY